MLAGDFKRAWIESDAVAASGGNPGALWDGRPLDRGRILIRCLHGLGDAIQFVRYAALLKAAGSRIIVETHPELVSLMALMPAVDEARTWASDSIQPDEWDNQIEVMELPYAFRTTLATIPAPVPYFAIGERAMREARERLRLDKLRPRVGLVWASSGWNPARSLPIRQILPLLQCDASFYSFQRGPEREALHVLKMRRAVFDTAHCTSEIAGTAADLCHMDIVITVDTMIAHLAGALGRPVWVLLPFDADWRWMTDRGDSPWYPTMRLFRQSSPGEWSRVIDRIRHELQQTVHSQRSAADRLSPT
jgi:ADP-heptose:LPS heptosyltransferase